MTRSGGEQIQHLDYWPFGDPRVDNQLATYDTRNKYTGHELDRSTDYTYAKQRYYNAAVGRFIGQDPIGQQTPETFLERPQELNLYSYVGNSPLRFIDPTGEQSFEARLFGFVNPTQNPGITKARQQLRREVPYGIALPAVTAVAAAPVGFAAITGGALLSNPYTAGPTINVTLRMYEDYADDGVLNDSIYQYGGSAVFGLGAGYAVAGKRFIKTVGYGTGISALENKLLDGSYNLDTALLDGFSAGFAKELISGAKTTSTVINPTADNLLQNSTELNLSIGGRFYLQHQHVDE